MRRVILGFALAAPLIVIALWRVSPGAAISVLALSHALLLYPTLRPNAQWLGPVVTNFRTEGRELWLTIDDGPTGDTLALLDLLERRKAKATFFVKGTLALENPGLIREMLARGHSVANHSQTHPSGSFWCLGPGRIAGEIDACNAELATITGIEPKWFRAPVGMKNPFVHPILDRRGMTLIGWSGRGFDATMSNADGVLRRLSPHIYPGAVIVLHQGRAWSLSVIERVIAEMQDRGYEFVIPDQSRLKTKR